MTKNRNSATSVLQYLLLMVAFFPVTVYAEGDAGTSPGLETKDLYYGEGELAPGEKPDPQNTLDVYLPRGNGPWPVVVFVHGGGWAFGDKEDIYLMPEFFVSNDISFVSINYRLRWEYTVYHQLEDIVTAIKWIVRNRETYGFNQQKIILMGYSSGGHLVSLVASNESFLSSVDLSFSNITAAIPIETKAFDVKRQIEETGNFLESRHLSLIFGTKPEVWAAASPINHIQPGKQHPPFIIMHRRGASSATLQSNAFAKKLVAAAATAIMIPSGERDSIPLERVIGLEGHPATLALLTFLNAL